MSELYDFMAKAYAGAPINQLTGSRLEVRDAEATVHLPISEKLCHAFGAVHGSMYFKCLDDAAYFAANSVCPDVWVLTADFHTRLLRPVPLQEGSLRAEGRVVSRGQRMIIAESVLYDKKGREVARGTGSFMPSDIPLSAPLFTGAGPTDDHVP